MERLHAVFVQALIEREPAADPIWLGIDSSSMAGPEAESSPDRGMIYMPNVPHASPPVSLGWQFSNKVSSSAPICCLDAIALPLSLPLVAQE